MKRRIIIRMTICSECKKEYETYPVILCDRIECFAMEQVIREIYYCEERDEGLCEKCRNKLYKDKVRIWRLWLNASALIMVIRSKQKGPQKIKWTNALKKIDEIDKELEKTKAVRKVLEKNKKELEEGKEYGYF